MCLIRPPYEGNSVVRDCGKSHKPPLEREKKSGFKKKKRIGRVMHITNSPDDKRKVTLGRTKIADLPKTELHMYFHSFSLTVYSGIF